LLPRRKVVVVIVKMNILIKEEGTRKESKLDRLCNAETVLIDKTQRSKTKISRSNPTALTKINLNL
jgi:hypothetical protein